MLSRLTSHRPISIALTGFIALAAPVASFALAPTVPSNSVGIVTLKDATGRVLADGSTTSSPSFASVTAADACSTGFTDAARISLITDSGAAFVVSASEPIADPAQPAVVSTDVVLADYPLSTGVTLALECLRLERGIAVAAPTVFSVGLDIASARFVVAPVPVIPTPTPTPTATTTPTATPTPTAKPSVTPAPRPAATPGAPGGGASQGGPMASTGLDIASPIAAALVLAALGVIAFIANQRRRTQQKGSLTERTDPNLLSDEE
ncbi:hypothetical protein AB4Y63_00660 [Leifsonia sp. YAF41]|uniref:hypothetical protein n=1 Tax=Leifsonia sp. YAF41 TaxID=3233086 RepID=UPI003F9E2DD7